MLALCLMLLGTYYAQNYASIIGGCLLKPIAVVYLMYVIILCVGTHMHPHIIIIT